MRVGARTLPHTQAGRRWSDDSPYGFRAFHSVMQCALPLSAGLRVVQACTRGGWLLLGVACTCFPDWYGTHVPL